MATAGKLDVARKFDFKQILLKRQGSGFGLNRVFIISSTGDSTQKMVSRIVQFF